MTPTIRSILLLANLSTKVKDALAIADVGLDGTDIAQHQIDAAGIALDSLETNAPKIGDMLFGETLTAEQWADNAREFRRANSDVMRLATAYGMYKPKSWID